MQSHLRAAALLLLLAACHQRPASVDGTWHATLASPGGELPFTLQISNSRAVILNGPERVPTSGIDVNGSQVMIRFDWYDSAIRAEVAQDGNVMNGVWTRTVPSRTARMAFHATRGDQPRFRPVASSGTVATVDGIWKAQFVDSDGTSPARGEFHQDPGSTRVTG